MKLYKNFEKSQNNLHISKKSYTFVAELYTLSNVKIMCRIKICNIGSISKVEMTLKKVTFILGPQSSGKSTIAKLLSLLQQL